MDTNHTLVLVAVTLLATGGAALADKKPGYDRVGGGEPHASRSEVIAPHGMAATSQPLTQVALDILKKGGNAIDAAIAANATLGLMEPTGNGIAETYMPDGEMPKKGERFQIIVNMVDFGMNLQEAGDAARVNHQGSSQPTGTTMTDGGVLHLEDGFSEKTRKALRAKGHTLDDSDGSFGGYQAIMWDKEEAVYYGASEVRKDGQAAGY